VILWKQVLRQKRCLIARLQLTAVAETLSWFYFNDDQSMALTGPSVSKRGRGHLVSIVLEQLYLSAPVRFASL
jgi:hypothetical protein